MLALRCLVLLSTGLASVGCTHHSAISGIDTSRPQPIERLAVTSSIHPERGIESLDYSAPGLTVHAIRRFRHDRTKDEYPCTGLSLRINDSEVPIPRESYSWSIVFDPKTPSLSLARNKSLLFLTYSGGDGGESHEIIYCVADGVLREIRTHRRGLLPNGLIGAIEQVR